MSETPTTAVTVDLVALYNSTLEEIGAIDVKLTSLKGTMAAILKNAADFATSLPMQDVISTYFENAKAYGATLAELGATKDRTLGEYLNGFRAYVTTVETFAQHLGTDWINAHHKGTDDSSALKARRTELVSMAEAQSKVCQQFVTAGVLPADTVLAPIPAMPGGSSTRTAGTRTGTKNSQVRFYRLNADGTKEYYVEGYDLSRVAWYQPFDKIGATALKTALTEAGWDGELFKSGEFAISVTHPGHADSKVPAGTVIDVTLGWEVASTDNATPTDTAPEAPKDAE